MSESDVDQIVNAVLYEGLILYPYRPTSVKNRRRFTFGRMYPREYSVLQDGKEPFTMTTDCLLESGEQPPELSVSVRFLQPVGRTIHDASGKAVESLEVAGRRYHSWHEAIERRIELPAIRVEGSQRTAHAFEFDAGTESVDVRDGTAIAGSVVRRSASISGRVSVELTTTNVDLGPTNVDLAPTNIGLAPTNVDLAPTSAGLASTIAGFAPTSAGLMRVTVRTENLSPLPDEVVADEDEVLLRTLASTHVILRVRNGTFISLMDPPEAYVDAVAACQNEGTWPVLVGEEGQRDVMLSSPIILYDYPKIAPESAGNLFDSTEIDELLTLRIKTMTDAEKSEMRAVDDVARRLLDRAESMDDDSLIQMHGAVRDLRRLADAPAPGHVLVSGRRLVVGDRVRIRPRGRTDVLDIALEGKTASIESIEQDFEDKLYLALVVDDDPGRDLGMLRQPGHRFFFSVDEVEPLQ